LFLKFSYLATVVRSANGAGGLTTRVFPLFRLRVWELGQQRDENFVFQELKLKLFFRRGQRSLRRLRTVTSAAGLLRRPRQHGPAAMAATTAACLLRGARTATMTTAAARG
jgi:hypothetical protein